MVMLIAGYDTTGMTLAYLIYQLAKNPEVQQRLREEVDQAFEESKGQFFIQCTVVMSVFCKPKHK